MIHLFIILKAGSRPQARLGRIAASGQLAPPARHARASRLVNPKRPTHILACDICRRCLVRAASSSLASPQRGHLQHDHLNSLLNLPATDVSSRRLLATAQDYNRLCGAQI